MGILSLALFVGLWGWGRQAFGWYDPEGQVQLALFACFLLGMVCGYRARD